MTRPTHTLVLAIALGALLPLAQAHCAWMEPGSRTAAAPAVAGERVDHDGCCPDRHDGTNSPEDSGCACLQIQAGQLPAAIVVPSPQSCGAAIAIRPADAALVRPSPRALSTRDIARFESPPGTARSPQAPRGPPRSA